MQLKVWSLIQRKNDTSASLHSCGYVYKWQLSIYSCSDKCVSLLKYEPVQLFPCKRPQVIREMGEISPDTWRIPDIFHTLYKNFVGIFLLCMFLCGDIYMYMYIYTDVWKHIYGSGNFTLVFYWRQQVEGPSVSNVAQIHRYIIVHMSNAHDKKFLKLLFYYPEKSI